MILYPFRKFITIFIKISLERYILLLLRMKLKYVFTFFYLYIYNMIIQNVLRFGAMQHEETVSRKPVINIFSLNYSTNGQSSQLIGIYVFH